MVVNAREDIELKIHVAFDAEAAIWYVAESDVPGLRLEAEDPFELVRRIADTVGELIALNAGELMGKSPRNGRPAVRFTPVFDNSVPVAAYA